MSYEGYERILCERGHLTTTDCYSFDYDDFKCPHCDSTRVAWRNSVDETNGIYDYDYENEKEILDEQGNPVRIDNYIELEIDKEKTKYCECCKRVVGPIVYKIPGKWNV